jgi:hypothetical protein
MAQFYPHGPLYTRICTASVDGILQLEELRQSFWGFWRVTGESVVYAHENWQWEQELF